MPNNALVEQGNVIKTSVQALLARMCIWVHLKQDALAG